jgi:hypothetical protein
MRGEGDLRGERGFDTDDGSGHPPFVVDELRRALVRNAQGFERRRAAVDLGA